MAGVLDALASYVTGMLTEMAQEEVAMLIGVSGEIDKLGVKLRDLKNFLADVDKRNITDTSVQAWVEELKRAMYDVTDILDLCRLKVMEKGPSRDMGCLNPLLFCMRNPLHAHDIGSRIKALNEKLDDICTRGRSFNFIKLEAYEKRKTARPPTVSRKTDPLLERSAVVGEKIEEDTRALVEMLTKDVAVNNDSIMVFAIVGVGGIGKTTLSKKVFNDKAIQGKFSKKIWLSITQEFDEVELLRTAIAVVDENSPRHGDMSQDKVLLVPSLANAIKDKKLFLVLDDMWGTNEWNNLLKAPFSHAAPGSRVLLTTRHEAVARGMRAQHPYHHVDKLGPEDAWSLLKKQVLAMEKNEAAIDMLKDIGLEIIEKCDGLPLAVKVMGGLLCQKENKRHDWQKVLNDATWSVSRMPEELSSAIYLSYEDLSPCLKQCFLLISVKPKKTIINDKQLVGMWIAEGFVHGNSDRLQELGIEYYKELILRNLIEPDATYIRSYNSQSICNMHDLVRSFAQFFTRDEALVAHDGENINRKLSSKSFLRVSIETKGVQSDEFGWRSLQEQRSLRLLMLTGYLKIQSTDSLTSFSSLRTLHLESTNFEALVKYLHQLKHLRYLSIENCKDIHSLPENIHNMRLLQLISLEGCKNLVKIPTSIVKFQHLRYLSLDSTGIVCLPRGFSALTNLMNLYDFPAHMDGTWCSLEELGPLSNLVTLRLKNLQKVSDASFATKAMLGEKMCLTFMSLNCDIEMGDDGLVKKGVYHKDQEILQEVFDELYPPPSIEIIHITGYFGLQLPRWMMSTATVPLNNLRILAMHKLSLCTQLPDGLCQLPFLEFLKVFHAPAIKHVGPEFVQPHSQHHPVSSQAVATFPRLHRMMLERMVEWEEWEWEEEVKAMPALEELTIKVCKLRCIPQGLSLHARSLKILAIWSIKGLRSLENFASVVELDLYDIPYLIRISNFPKLQKLEIDRCPMVDSLQEMNVLHRLVVTLLYSEKRLPLYMQTVKPSHLQLNCSLTLLAFMAVGKSGPEWDKFSHIQKVEAYSNSEDIEKRWHVFYTSEPYSMETNIDLQEWLSEEVYSGNDDEAGVNNNQDKNEKEFMGQDPIVTREEEGGAVN